MTDENAEEAYCLQCIQQIQQQAQKDMKPYIDRLLRIHSMRPTPPFVVTLEQWSSLTKSAEQEARKP